jgi:hypothetical protein
MRRVFAIGLAILIVMIATQGAVAQDGQTANDKLLKILKDRQIISDEEYAELKTEMLQEQTEADRRLGDLDRSIADYLAKEGDAIGSNVTYTKSVGYGLATGERNGFGFASTDGLFSLNIGGLFSFEYMAVDRDRDEFPELNDSMYDDYSKRDRQNLTLTQLRWHFSGHAFDPALTYFVEFGSFYGSDYVSQAVGNGLTEVQRLDGDGYYCSEDYFSTELLEAWVNWNICDWTNLKFGSMKVPMTRQWQVHQSDLQFGRRALPFNPGLGLNSAADSAVNLRESCCLVGGYDEGLMFWDVLDVPWFGDPFDQFKFEYAVGIFDGQFASGGSWFEPVFRGAIYPLGAVDYVESDWRQSGDPTFGFGAYYSYDQGPEHADRMQSVYGYDFVMKWYGFFLTAEWMRCKEDARGYDARRTRAWYIQGSYMVLPNEVELMARYGRVAWPWNAGGVGQSIPDYTSEWSVGAAYYWESHNLKALFEIGQTSTDWDDYMDEDPEDIDVFFVRLMFQLEW